MKKVFSSHSEICHVWANNKDLTDGRAGNIFFNNSPHFDNRAGKRIIYSYGYHYELARFIDDNTVLINDSGYSSSTGKHINIIIGATSHYRQFFDTQTDLDFCLDRVLTAFDRLAVARKPEIYINEINSVYRSIIEYNTYCRTLGKLKKDKRYQQIKRICNKVNNSPDLKKTMQKRAAVIKAETKARNLEAKNRAKIAIEKWKNHDGYYPNFGKYTYLRISKDGKFIETSQRVKVPINEAKRILNLINNKKALGVKIDNKYIITAINGALVSGCHTIPIEEINEIKEQLI